MKRIYDIVLKDHFKDNRQIALLCGPRQVGKTTTAKNTNPKIYLNWDNPEHRKNILAGYGNIVHDNDLSLQPAAETHIIFDEIHKFPKWKNYIKGFFDTYENQYNIIVTGSARLNIYKRGSDSLMGRYFLYRMHPLTVGELISRKEIPDAPIQNPIIVTANDFNHIVEFGGFPEPFLKGDKRFYNRWKKLRIEQFFREDIRDLTNIHEISQLEILAELLENRAGQLINYNSLASDIQVSINTIKNWIAVLEQLYYCFRIKPWSKNVPKTLLKQPKIYLRDWSVINDKGARNENFIACHLLKSVEYWTDTGYGLFKLFFLRDKLKREADFLITKDNNPWIIVEVKSSERGGISPSLEYFASIVKAEYAFQLDMSADYIERDCFSITRPMRVPAKTFLAQLV